MVSLMMAAYFIVRVSSRVVHLPQLGVYRNNLNRRYRAWRATDYRSEAPRRYRHLGCVGTNHGPQDYPRAAYADCFSCLRKVACPNSTIFSVSVKKFIGRRRNFSVIHCMKTCKICKLDKSLKLFSDSPKGRLGKASNCIECEKTRKQASHLKHFEANREKRKLYRDENKATIRAWRRKHYQENRERLIQETLDYWKTPQGAAKRKASYTKWAAIPHNKIAIHLRSRLTALTRGFNKSAHTTQLLGMDFKTFRSYLESHFLPGMSWDNYGKHGWHIDHVLPCSYFDLSIPENQVLCCNYRNLRPLWAKENLSKNDAIPANHLELLDKLKREINPQTVG